MTDLLPPPPVRRRRTGQVVTLAMAFVWSVGLLVAAVTLPAYQGTTVSSTGESHSTTSTLVGENGAGVLLVVAIPLAAVLVVSTLQWWRRHRGRPGAGPLAWTVVGVLGAFTFLAMMTIGIFIVPVVVLLVVACAAASASR